MKTPNEILKNHYTFVDDLGEIEYNDLLSAISFAQKDAYNSAIDNVDDIIENHEEEVYIGVVNDIKNLKK